MRQGDVFLGKDKSQRMLLRVEIQPFNQAPTDGERDVQLAPTVPSHLPVPVEWNSKLSTLPLECLDALAPFVR